MSLARMCLLLLLACGGRDAPEIQPLEPLEPPVCHEGNWRIVDDRYVLCSGAGRWEDAGAVYP